MKTTNDAYDARRTEVAELLARIETALTSRVPSRPDWADVGSLTEIAGRLRDVAEFAERMRG
jgi:hypothetical protein